MRGAEEHHKLRWEKLPMVIRKPRVDWSSLEALFRVGTLGSLSDGELLDCFLAGRDASGHEAFRILVERHGPMVLGLCRSVVREPHLAEDAFQATFLVLVQHGRSIRRRDTIGPWLHGVATRVARRARRRTAVRHSRERPIDGEIPAKDGNLAACDGPAADQIVHDEITRLPESLKGPLVLCCLEGLSYDAAAGRLGVTEPTLRGRLHRARKRLASRLQQRGLDITTALVPLEPASVATLAVPRALAAATIEFSNRWSTVSKLIAGAPVVPAPIAYLAQGVIKTMLLQSIKIPAVVALVSAGVLGTVALAQQGQEPAGGAPAAPGQAQPAAPTPKEIEQEVARKEQRLAKEALRLGELTEKIAERLNVVVNAEIPKDATLDAIIRLIKDQTSDPPRFYGIPIYINPAGLAELRLTMEAPVTIQPAHVTVRTSP